MNSFVTVAPSSHYHDACVLARFCKSSDYLVVGFNQWVKWYNEARYTSQFIKPPAPAFIGDSYEIALDVRNALNEGIGND